MTNDPIEHRDGGQHCSSTGNERDREIKNQIPFSDHAYGDLAYTHHLLDESTMFDVTVCAYRKRRRCWCWSL